MFVYVHEYAFSWRPTCWYTASYGCLHTSQIVCAEMPPYIQPYIHPYIRIVCAWSCLLRPCMLCHVKLHCEKLAKRWLAHNTHNTPRLRRRACGPQPGSGLSMATLRTRTHGISLSGRHAHIYKCIHIAGHHSICVDIHIRCTKTGVYAHCLATQGNSSLQLLPKACDVHARWLELTWMTSCCWMSCCCCCCCCWMRMKNVMRRSCKARCSSVFASSMLTSLGSALQIQSPASSLSLMHMLLHVAKSYQRIWIYVVDFLSLLLFLCWLWCLLWHFLLFAFLLFTKGLAFNLCTGHTFLWSIRLWNNNREIVPALNCTENACIIIFADFQRKHPSVDEN